MSEEESQKTRRILLVDDEPDILDSLKDLLETGLENVEVKTAPDGDSGLKELGEGGIEIIVSDFKMPGMDGLEFLRRAKDQAPSVPRIMMTAFPDLQIAIDAINDAAIETFFTKPLAPDEVLRVVGSVLDEKKAERLRSRAFARALDLARKGKDEEASS